MSKTIKKAVQARLKAARIKACEEGIKLQQQRIAKGGDGMKKAIRKFLEKQVKNAGFEIRGFTQRKEVST